jgi:hypothetical protein
MQTSGRHGPTCDCSSQAWASARSVRGGPVYYSFPLIAEAMGRDLGWSKPDLYGAATIGLLLSGLAAYPVGSAIDRGHGRTIMAGASVLAGILLIACRKLKASPSLHLARRHRLPPSSGPH